MAWCWSESFSCSLFERAIFLGKTYESDEFLAGTPAWAKLVRTVGRLPRGQQADVALLQAIVGPWAAVRPSWSA